MKKTLTFVFRLLVLLCGIALAGFIVWQLFTNAPMLDVNVQTKGPVIIVIYSLVALITLGAAISFFTDKNMGSTIFLGGLLTVIAIILWIQIKTWQIFIAGILFTACLYRYSVHFLEKKTKKLKKLHFRKNFCVFLRNK